MAAENLLQNRFGNQLQQDVPLSTFTSLKIGGPAQYLVIASTSKDIIDALRIARQVNIPFYFLSGCSNVLINDKGLQGVVIINQSQSIEWHDDYSLQLDGGYHLDQLVTDVSQRGWADLSFAAGIPGSIGGALAGGAGAFGHLVCKYLIEALILHPDGTTENQPGDALGIQYRTSIAKQKKDIILEARLGPFQQGDSQSLLDACQSIRAERESKHPGPDLPSAGSFFKNLPPSKPGGRRTAAGKLLDEAGVKSLRVGDAGVFEKHANIIVNYGNATAQQVNELADQMAQRVKDHFGITLEREVQYLC